MIKIKILFSYSVNRSKMNNINLDTRAKIIELLKIGYSVRHVAKTCNMNHMTVFRIKKKFLGELEGQKAGRPRLLNDRDCRHLANLVTSGTDVTPAAAASTLNIRCSRWTARRGLQRIGLKATVKKKKPMLTSRHIKLRLEFAAVHKHWTLHDWDRVIWSDETKINRFQSDGRSWYWSRDPNELSPNNVIQTVKHGGGSIMVWGCITKNGVGPLVRIEGIMRKEQYLNILQQNLPAVVENMGLDAEKVIFQQDNDPKHKSKVVTNWLEKQKFSTMTWPPQSPDLNPIENFWSHVKSQLAKYTNPPKGMDELWDRVRDIWSSIPPDFVQKYTHSMPSRINALSKNKGYWIKY